MLIRRSTSTERLSSGTAELEETFTVQNSSLVTKMQTRTSLQTLHVNSPALYILSTCTIFMFHPVFLVSTIYDGQQMVPALNALGINGAVYGNHDFGETTQFQFLRNCNIVPII